MTRTDNPPQTEPKGGQTGYRGEKLADNVAHFVRLLRRAGMTVGPATVIDCVAATTTIDLGRRTEFYHALASCVVLECCFSSER